MEILEAIAWIRLIIGGFLLLCGLVIFLVEVYGVFHMKYVLNRMHAAAMGDTLGLGFSLAGLMILSGFNFTTLKMGLIILFLWLASPISSHLLSKLEVSTNEKLDKHCQIYIHLEDLEQELAEREEQENKMKKETGGVKI